MTPDTIIQLISSLGFPIIVCGALAWYIVKRDKESLEERNAIEAAHATELKEIKEAIVNNTLVMQKLSDQLSITSSSFQKTSTD